MNFEKVRENLENEVMGKNFESDISSLYLLVYRII